MSILASDIKLVASKVMLDVPEGGGGPVSTEIADGASNQIFPDISEVDRAGGAVNLRQVFISVQTEDTDTLLGSNIIVAKPPEDPNVSITLFTTGGVFDKRTDAESRLESYLAAGPLFSGYLFGNHIEGQRTITMAQQPNTQLVVTGETLMLSLNEASGSPTQQYFRVTEVTAETRTFYDNSTAPPTPYDMLVVTAGLTDSLSRDFPGFDVSRLGPTYGALNSGTQIRETVVADAARYYGVVKVTDAVAIGDFSVQADSIYTHLVPSAQIETALADVRMNSQSTAVVQLSDTAVLRAFIALAWSTTAALFIGGSVTPGSLNLIPAGFGAVTDNGGKLIQGGAQVGTIDYGNGVLTLSTNIFGGATPSVTAAWKPATRVTIVTSSSSIPVTSTGQRVTYVVTMLQIPIAGTLQVSFRAQGRWYVLQDDGSGALRGSDSSFGVGTLNRITGTVSLTLGALPDVGSEVIFEYAPSASFTPAASVPVNTNDLEQWSHFRKVIGLNKAITPGTLSLTWNDGSARSATDANGVLTGDATGVVTYANGNIQFAPNTLPAKGTTINIALTDTTKVNGTVTSFGGGSTTWTGSLAAAINPGSVQFSVAVSYPVRQYPGIDSSPEQLIRVFDAGDGKLYVSNVTNNLQVGTINYSTGAYVLNVHSTSFQSTQSTWGKVTSLATGMEPAIVLTGSETRMLTLTILAAPTIPLAAPPWAWWTGAQALAAETQFAGGAGASYTGTIVFDLIQLPERLADSAANGRLASFVLGPDYYAVSLSASVTRNPLPATGEGTAVGEFSTLITGSGYAVTCVNLDVWNAGVTSQATSIAQGRAATISGAGTTTLVDVAVFRTAIAPIKNGSFSVVGTLTDGTAINATADSSGVIASGTAAVGSTPGTYGVFGTIDYTYGVVKLHFGRRVPDSMAADPTVSDLSNLGIAGVHYVQSQGVQADTLRYNASAYTYLPLDAGLIGVDPVRLPSDGRVPIFRAGSFAVIGESFDYTQTVTNSTVITTGHVRLSRVTVKGHDGSDIEAGFTADLEAGTITFTNVTGYSQPITATARIEDMMLVSDAQISGQLTFTRAVTHAYSTAAYVSSAVVPGNLKARVSATFDQASWDGVTFSDTVVGGVATASYDDTNHSIEVTNKGASTERFALQFTTNSAFRVVSEHLGVIAIGSINTDCSPLNPATSEPYFTIRASGWGTGWAVGNILRINTVGALSAVWIIRTVQQGPESELDDSTTILIRGDVDRP